MTYDGTFEWATYSCSRGRGDHYILFTVIAKDTAGRALSGANVSIIGNGLTVNGTTGANGMYAPDTHFADGEYEVKVAYQAGDTTASTSGQVRLIDGWVSGGVGALSLGNTPSDNGSGGGSSSSGGFRCSMCDVYESNRSKPVIGVIYTIIHFFVHLIQRIIYAFGR